MIFCFYRTLSLLHFLIMINQNVNNWKMCNLLILFLLSLFLQNIKPPVPSRSQLLDDAMSELSILWLANGIPPPHHICMGRFAKGGLGTATFLRYPPGRIYDYFLQKQIGELSIDPNILCGRLVMIPEVSLWHCYFFQ